MAGKQFTIEGEFLVDGPVIFRNAVCNDGQTWLVKNMTAEEPHNSEAESKLFCEAALAIKMPHPNLSLLQDALVMNGTITLVYEPCAHPLPHMQQRHIRTGFPMPEVKRIMYQLLSVVSFLHQHSISHQGLRPQCIMLQESGLLKLNGLDSARIMPKGKPGASQQAPSATAGKYSAPEIILGDSSGFAADIWAIGCICAELLTGRPLFEGTTEADVLWSITKARGMIPRHISIAQGRPDCQSMLSKIAGAGSKDKLKDKFEKLDRPAFKFLDRCLQTDPKKRATCEDLQKLEFVLGMPPGLRELLVHESELQKVKMDPAEQHRLAASVAKLADFLAPRRPPPNANQPRVLRSGAATDIAVLNRSNSIVATGAMRVSSVTRPNLPPDKDRLSMMRNGADVRRASAAVLEAAIGAKIDIHSNPASLGRVSDWLSSVPASVEPSLHEAATLEAASCKHGRRTGEVLHSPEAPMPSPIGRATAMKLMTPLVSRGASYTDDAGALSEGGGGVVSRSISLVSPFQARQLTTAATTSKPGGMLQQATSIFANDRGMTRRSALHAAPPPVAGSSFSGGHADFPSRPLDMHKAPSATLTRMPTLDVRRLESIPSPVTRYKDATGAGSDLSEMGRRSSLRYVPVAKSLSQEVGSFLEQHMGVPVSPVVSPMLMRPGFNPALRLTMQPRSGRGGTDLRL